MNTPVAINTLTRTGIRAGRFTLVALLLSGCAAAPKPLPEAIAQPPSGDLQLVEVTRDPESFAGSPVRWGGSVLSVTATGEKEAGEGAFHVEVVGRTLNRGGKPRLGSGSDGRFVILAPTAKDAEQYRAGDLITVAGTVLGATDGHIGDQPATFPLIRVSDHYRWREDPYAWDPYYPYGHYPYGHWRFGLGIGTGGHYHLGARHRFGYYPHHGWPYYGWRRYHRYPYWHRRY
ncbi:MAG: Slp family lipoprotein [Gammaproteobacteria bacterium]